MLGGVSERAGAKAGGSNLSASASSAILRVSWRSKASRSAGWRRPSRGDVKEWILVGPSVVLGTSQHGDAPMTADARRTPRRGTTSSMRHKAYALDASTRDRCMRLRGRVLHSVLRPVLVNPHYALGASRVVGRASRHHGWANPGNREEPALGSARTDESAARHMSPASQDEGRGMRKKRKAVEAVVPTRIRESKVWLPARRSAVAEVSRRRLVPNKLGIRAPKRAVRVE